METRELLMSAENTNGSVIFERDDTNSMSESIRGTFIVTVKTKSHYDDCTAEFCCYEPAIQFFRDKAKNVIYAQEITIPIEQFLWMTAPGPED